MCLYVGRTFLQSIAVLTGNTYKAVDSEQSLYYMPGFIKHGSELA